MKGFCRAKATSGFWFLPFGTCSGLISRRFKETLASASGSADHCRPIRLHGSQALMVPKRRNTDLTAVHGVKDRRVWSVGWGWS
ncbi:unnamed protein product [Lota lota]